MNIRKIGRALAWLGVAAAGLAVSLAFVMLAVNWEDRPPSPEALALSRLDRGPALADGENAYIYMLGLSVPQDQDPLAWGIARKRWLLDPGAHRGASELPGVTVPAKAAYAGDVADLADACGQAGPDCAAALQRSPAALDAWMQQEAWRVLRYDALLLRKGWQETIPESPADPFPPYQHALEMQRLYLLRSWRFATAGEAQAVAATLDRDARFWRAMLADSDLLISKMIAAAGLRRNLAYGTLAIRALPATSAAAGVPESWKEPIDRKERSLLRALAGEWRWTQSITRGIRSGDPAPGLEPGISDRAMGVFFQPQDTANIHAAGIYAFDRERDVPYDRLRVASRRLPHVPAVGLYNPVGRLLYQLIPASYADYASRIADLEGMRRGALAATTLHGQGVAVGSVDAALKSIAIRDPYSDDPLAWNETSRTITFDALSKWPRGVQDFGIAY